MNKWGIIAVTVLLSIGASSLFVLPLNQEMYDTSYQAAAPVTIPPPFAVTHIETPDPLKALYMTSYVGGHEKLRTALVDLIDRTELNAVVLDIKDYTGRISFKVEDEKLIEIGSVENRIPDIKEFIAFLHSKDIYVIGRISVFQDSFFVKRHPEYAVKTKSGAVWKDRKGISWLDIGAKPVWDYITMIGNEAYSVGFDELNFDYIRFPSDGDMNDISYPYSQGKVKSQVLKEFYAHLDKTFRSKDIPISIDLFGMTTSNTDDLGIGQVLEDALAHFDYVSPMVYPSHYPPNFNGWKNPSAMPYEVIFYAMKKGHDRAVTASTTPLKLRPWLQDFSIGGTSYTPAMVRAQIQATYDVGLTSWMMWNASNRYTEEALQI
ncbi:MAG: putative glycoside hydrolase [bacterium]|nr:putative glycoside hydrolase [bacterium]